MNTRYWIPFAGFEQLDSDEVRQLELDPIYNWYGFYTEWLDRGFLWFVIARSY